MIWKAFTFTHQWKLRFRVWNGTDNPPGHRPPVLWTWSKHQNQNQWQNHRETRVNISEGGVHCPWETVTLTFRHRQRPSQTFRDLHRPPWPSYEGLVAVVGIIVLFSLLFTFIHFLFTCYFYLFLLIFLPILLFFFNSVHFVAEFILFFYILWNFLLFFSHNLSFYIFLIIFVVLLSICSLVYLISFMLDVLCTFYPHFSFKWFIFSI